MLLLKELQEDLDKIYESLDLTQLKSEEIPMVVQIII